MSPAIFVRTLGLIVLPLTAFAADTKDSTNEALLQAIEKGNIGEIKQALRQGADVNTRDKTGASALMIASLYGNAESVNLLLNKGSDPNLANTAGATALLWSAGDFEKVRALVGKGANVNAEAKSGRTPLMAAASCAGNVNTVKLLLAKGADVKKVSAIGGGPVLAAANIGDEALLRILLAAGGDPNEKNGVGLTALMTAAQFPRPQPLKVLLDAGARVNDQSGRRPLAKVGLQELGELTALLLAAPVSNPQVIKLLLDAGADVRAKDMRGMTPLMMAVASEYQDEQTVRLLMAKGSDPTVTANDGQTIAAWAEKFGNAKITKLVTSELGSQTPMPVAKLANAERPLQRAIEQTIALLQASSTQYFAKSGCVGCHHQILTGMAVGVARDRGIKVNETLVQEQLRTTQSVRAADREGLAQGFSRGGAPMTDSALLVSWGAQHHRPDRLTTAMAHSLGSMQSADGSWRGHIVRPPMEYSPFTETAFAIRALQLYAPKGRKDEFAKRVRHARDWLVASTPEHNEERTMRLLGLAWSTASASDITKAGRELMAEQRPDGGWAQRSGWESDAYATGEALYALAAGAGVPVTDAGFRRGVEFLRKTQLQDGSWYVRSRSVKFQPYFDSAFPHEHDQWISAAASAWATMALSLAAEPSSIASR